MNKKRIVVGSHAFLFPEGASFTLPDPGTAGRSAKPAYNDPAWIDCGVSKWKIGPNHKTEEFYAPAPGGYQLYDEIVVSKGLTLKGTLMEMSNIVWQMLLASATLPTSPTAGGQYNPLEGSPIVRAWLKLQNYDQDNALINTVDVFCGIKVPGDVEFSDKPVDVDVEAKVYWSPYNTGTLA